MMFALLTVVPLAMQAADFDALYQKFLTSKSSADAQKLVDELAKEEWLDPDYAIKDEYKKEVVAVAHYGMAEFYYDGNNFDKGFKAGQAALASMKNKEEFLASDCYNVLGCIAQRAGKFLEAIDYSKECLAIDEKMGDKERISGDLNAIAGIYLSLEDTKEAQMYILKAIDVQRKLNDNDRLAIRLGMASEIFIKAKDYKKALAFAKEAYECNMKTGNKGKAAVRQSQIAAVYFEMGNFAETEKLLNQAIPVLESEKNLNSLAICYAQMGDINLKKGDDAEATEFYQKSIALCNEIGNRYIERRSQKGLWASMKGSNPSEALKHLERYSELNDSIFKEESARQASIFDAKYRNEELKAKNAEYLARNRVIISTSIIIVLLLIVAIAALFFAYKQKAKAHKVASQVEEMRTAFFTNITHEFRTPLTVILGASKRLQSGKMAEGENVKTLAGMITRQGDSLLTLINQLLDISKVKSEIGDPEWRNGDIVPFLRMIVENHKDAAQQRHINLAFTPKENEIKMDFVPDYVTKVLNNLLSNALKYTDKHGQVFVAVSVEGEDLRIRVADTGRGIPKEDLPHIFDAFQQASNKGNVVGSGVGLALVKQIIDTVNGEITASSTVGKGTVFTILVPIKQERGTKPLGETDAEAIEKPAVETEEQLLASNAEASAGAEQPIVLIVEDNSDISYYIGSQLQSRYRVFYAHNGREGLEEAQDLMPDVIISDLMMPEMDGYELCRQIHASEVLNHIPIIILTAKTAEEERIKALQVGADSFMNKPFNSEELELRVKQLIDQRRALREKYSQALATGNEKEVNITKANREFLNKFVDIIHSQMSQSDIDIDEVASKLCMSRKQLRSKIMSITGENTSTYILQIRLSKACRLLRSTDMPIGEVAQKCGFDDSAYFSRIFKQTYSSTPSQYRKTVE